MEQKFHILVVEDDKEIREGIEIYLRNQGYEVHQAANGAEGLKIIGQEEIHLAIVPSRSRCAHRSHPQRTPCPDS